MRHAQPQANYGNEETGHGDTIETIPGLQENAIRHSVISHLMREIDKRRTFVRLYQLR